ncbi:hypothetical protein HZS_3177, partial [Henneguya salminicola]
MICLWIAVFCISITIKTVEAPRRGKKTSTPPPQNFAPSSTLTISAKLSDYAPKNSGPSVPSLLTELLPIIEERGFENEGLYRISGVKSTIDTIVNQYMQTKPLDYREANINVLTGVVKMFLRKMGEPLLTTSLRFKFLDFSNAYLETKHEYRKSKVNINLKRLILELPKSNRDTLAYLMLHLKRICATTPGIGPSKQNLIMLFTPSIFGDVEVQDYQESLNLQPRMNAVVSVLFDLPVKFYESILKNCIDELKKVSRTIGM